jgi:hypothetical protein
MRLRGSRDKKLHRVANKYPHGKLCKPRRTNQAGKYHQYNRCKPMPRRQSKAPWRNLRSLHPQTLQGKSLRDIRHNSRRPSSSAIQQRTARSPMNRFDSEKSQVRKKRTQHNRTQEKRSPAHMLRSQLNHCTH